MGKYRDNGFIKKVGERIRHTREKKKLSLEDLAFMTGFTIATLGEIERGQVNTDISHIAAIGQALEIAPHLLLDVEVELGARFGLPPNRESRTNTTLHVKELIETDYFDTERTVNAVIDYVKSKSGVLLSSSPVSGALKSLAEEGLLEYSTTGRKHAYKRKKSI